MVVKCELCKTEPTVPFKLDCGHWFCFLCFEYEWSCDDPKCPECDENIIGVPNDYINNKNYLWLYSSNYSNTWWCYNSDLNEKIELLYQQSLKPKEEAEKKDDDGIKLTLDKKIKTSKSKPNNPALSFSTLNVASIDNMDDTTDLTVNFVDEDDDATSSESPQPPKKKVVVISPIMKIGNADYKIDLDEMKQISILDPNKKRNIKRIEVPINIVKKAFPDLFTYLVSTHNIVGINSKKFDG